MESGFFSAPHLQCRNNGVVGAARARSVWQHSMVLTWSGVMGVPPKGLYGLFGRAPALKTQLQSMCSTMEQLYGGADLAPNRLVELQL
jgi:hypothetical protein